MTLQKKIHKLTWKLSNINNQTPKKITNSTQLNEKNHRSKGYTARDNNWIPLIANPLKDQINKQNWGITSIDPPTMAIGEQGKGEIDELIRVWWRDSRFGGKFSKWARSCSKPDVSMLKWWVKIHVFDSGPDTWHVLAGFVVHLIGFLCKTPSECFKLFEYLDFENLNKN